MLQNKQQEFQFNPRDVEFAETHDSRIAQQWKEKFLVGAMEHGGIGKPSLVERKGLLRENLREHYDGISYTLAIQERLDRALSSLRAIHKDRSVDSVTLDYVIGEVIELLQ